ncbi:MAG: hypothetical protein COB81_03785 [Flavobacteriaceae bacterium]|nr:MAG: hypothetical protein COB81_03785 [Flavobacteriaceae bacterium]
MVGVDHVAYDYASLRDLLENYDGFKAQGITPYWCINHGMSVSLYYADPDGNQMEFTADVFATKAEGSAYFHNLKEDDNPVGVEYDPDEWLTKLRSGTLEAELLKFDAAGEVSPIRGAMMA